MHSQKLFEGKRELIVKELLISLGKSFGLERQPINLNMVSTFVRINIIDFISY
tara:strand:+ start:249 stop:407 length:159 start_codon:yes stop_codon:yes gene_type:complete